MKRIDFENGTVTGNILGAALPMLAAQLLNLLYNIVDRVYIARIPHVGTGSTRGSRDLFSVIMIITALQISSAAVVHLCFQFTEEKKKRRQQSKL